MNLQELIDELTSPLNTEEAIEELKKQFANIPVNDSDNGGLISETDKLKKQIKELKALLKKYKNLLAQSQPGIGGRM